MGIRSPINSLHSPQIDENKYRLYIQYKSKDIKYDPFRLMREGYVVINIIDVPARTSIRPCTQSLKDVLKDLGTENVLNIVINGGTQEELQQLLKIYTSLKYWNEISYLEEMDVFHQYGVEAIQQVIKPKGDVMDTLVLGLSPFSIAHTRLINFKGSPKSSSKYTLHVKFTKFCNRVSAMDGQDGELFFGNAPHFCSILELDDETYDRRMYPEIELFIKSDDLPSLKKIKSDFMIFMSPSWTYKRICFKLLFGKGCFEATKRSSETDKYIISFGEYESRLITYLQYY